MRRKGSVERKRERDVKTEREGASAKILNLKIEAHGCFKQIYTHRIKKKEQTNHVPQRHGNIQHQLKLRFSFYKEVNLWFAKFDIGFP